MGWFFNKNKENTNENNNQQNLNQNHQSSSKFKTTSSHYSKKRKCQNDPEDNQYLICKTVIKDNNGTREQEERIPKNGNGTSFFQQSSSSFQSSGIFSPFFNQSQQQKVFQKSPSFFIQPSFFDFHNSTPGLNQRNPNDENIESQSFVRSYGQSKECHPDPEDKEYLICKSKIFDGNETKQVQQRVKLSDQFVIPSFRGEFSNMGKQIDKQIHEMMRQINSGFNSIMPFIGPMVGLFNAFSSPQSFGQNNYNANRNPKGHSFNKKKQDETDKKKYFTSNAGKKDTNIYDL